MTDAAMTDAPPAATLADPSLEHLLARLGVLEARVRSAVVRRRATDPEPDLRFRGLYVSEAAVDELLDRPASPAPDVEGARLLTEAESRADAWAADGEDLRLRRLAGSFDLDEIDLEILLVALAPDLDPRLERLYAYLQDDVSRRRASIGLTLELCGLAATSAEARARLSEAGPLVAAGLVVIEEVGRPILTRSLRVPDRIASHLLGDDSLEVELGRIVDASALPSPSGASKSLARALAEGISPVYLRETGVSSGVATAASSAGTLGAGTIVIDLTRLAGLARPADVAKLAIREARLRRLALVATPIEALVERAAETIATLAEAPWPVVIVGRRAWDPTWSRAIPLLLDAPTASSPERIGLWESALSPENGSGATNGHLHQLIKATQAFHLNAVQVARAAAAGRIRARAADRALQPADLNSGARAQNGAGLDRLAHRMEPTAGWRDLVLPPDIRTQLNELAARARHRERVLVEWGIGGRASRGRGITTLFAGDSGTGKTLAAEVIAAELGLDLYVIDLSTVIDKYIGETEKNLDRIFAEADRVNGVLLFDEADAIFGKRSEVRDARDRYANVEVAYLLQRMERFDGLAVLTTNLRANLDEAFTRRIDVIVDFPMPQEESRAALWRMHLPGQLPQAEDLDIEFMARRFRLSGGNVRNICLTAAFLAADADRPVAMADLIRATEREYRKLGRLTVEAEFGSYHSLLTQAATAGANVESH